LKKCFCKAILNNNKIPALTNWGGGGKYSALVFGVGKNVAKQHGCRDRFKQSQKFSWFDFQGLVQVNFLLELLKML
jgi:hypothetical protein